MAAKPVWCCRSHPGSRTLDLDCEITLHSRGAPGTIEVHADEIRVALVDVSRDADARTPSRSRAR